ncbi:MAG TPA: hypothetical protein VEU73_04175, partial [Gemmatimonadales bacterium]|nr:hypothetical protein [Gemmatimonadales bacterium]
MIEQQEASWRRQWDTVFGRGMEVLDQLNDDAPFPPSHDPPSARSGHPVGSFIPRSAVFQPGRLLIVRSTQRVSIHDDLGLQSERSWRMWQWKSDKDLERDVRDELAFDPRVDVKAITLSAKG